MYSKKYSRNDTLRRFADATLLLSRQIKFNLFIIQFKVVIDKLCVTFLKTNLVILNNNIARGFFSSPHKYGLCDYVRLRDKQTIFLRTFSALFTGPLCTIDSLLPAMLRKIAR